MNDEKESKRKVRIFDSMAGDCIIILTDAPGDVIRQWIQNRKEELKEGKSTGFGLLKDYYIKLLHNSETDPVENIDIIGYDESYRTNTIRVKNCFIPKKEDPEEKSSENFFAKMWRGKL